jgi:mannose-6-phosphate isomerase-like protein (cupin superfamily)
LKSDAEDRILNQEHHLERPRRTPVPVTAHLDSLVSVPAFAPTELSPPETVPVEALCDIATGLARVERVVPASGGDDPETPRSSRLIATAAYDVWLITWPPGSQIGWHDHDAATSVIRVVRGALIEWLGEGRRELRPGLSEVTPPRTAHLLRNSTNVETTSLHVYSPPLSAVTYHDPASAALLHPAGGGVARTAPIRSRRAEATSSGLRRPRA